MAVRGSRFAKDQPARRDADGHSLPSDEFMYFVAVEVVCRVCDRQGVYSVLSAWAIETNGPEFRSDQVFQMGGTRSVELQEVREPDGSMRRRYQFRCPRCGHAPQFREERIDAALKELYVPGAKGLPHKVRL